MSDDLEMIRRELEEESLEDLKEEYKIIISELGPGDNCDDLLTVYLDVIGKKMNLPPDPLTPEQHYEEFLKRLKRQNRLRRFTEWFKKIFRLK